MPLNEVSQKFCRTFGQLFLHNVHLNGLRALLYCFGLSASRYIEYASSLSFLSSEPKADSVMLEIGCGHSILPTLWVEAGVQVVVVDISRKALKWQTNKCKEASRKSLSAILADGRYMPLKDQAIPAVSCISAIEHLPHNGDVQMAHEIGRILKPNGQCVVSFPLSLDGGSYTKRGCGTEIPPFLRHLLKPILPILFDRFGVDRTSSYFERFYSLEDASKRIITPSLCVKEDYWTLKSNSIVRFIYEKVIPTGVFAPFDFLMSRFLTLSKRTRNMEALILKMRKPERIL